MSLFLRRLLGLYVPIAYTGQAETAAMLSLREPKKKACHQNFLEMSLFGTKASFIGLIREWTLGIDK